MKYQDASREILEKLNMWKVLPSMVGYIEYSMEKKINNNNNKEYSMELGLFDLKTRKHFGYF